MIKDKIGPQLKKAFSESIEKTKTTQKEHGFLLCSNDKILPSKMKTEGLMFGMMIDTRPGICPGKIQGFFHVHPHKALIDIVMGRKLSYEEIEQLRKKPTEVDKKYITIQQPSHKDVLSAFITKCDGITEGTVCTASDLGTDKVECWTPKKNSANFVTCNLAKIDDKMTKEIGDIPKRWIRPLFEKEVIILNK